MATRIKTYDLHRLVRFIESKHVAVPEFQRGFVWKTGQVKKLFDSLVKQYPVGSFILWETTQNIDARTLDGEDLPQKKYLILDGQQRMASIYYLCRQKVFVLPHIKDKFHETCNNREKHVIDFEKFHINKDENGLFLEYSKQSSCKLDFQRMVRLLKNYPFSVITISLDDYRSAIEVFERINQSGTRISTESIFISETWNKHSNLGKILRKWKTAKDGSLTSGIDTVIFIHVFAIILQVDEKKLKRQKIEINLNTLKKIAEEIRQESRNKYNHIFKLAVTSVARAVQYLKQEYGIISLRELPSQTMITILAIFFYYHKKGLTQKQKVELRKWFWRSSLSNRYIGSGYSANISMDAKQMYELAKSDKSMDIPKESTKIFAKLQGVDIRAGRSTYRNILKQALWQQSPVFINDKVNRNDVESGQHKPENDHFFPYDLYRKGIIGEEINNILNIHFLNGDENSIKKDMLPSVWLEKRIKEINAPPRAVEKYFASQLLPFKTARDVQRYERGLKYTNLKAKKAKFKRSYETFLRRRFKLFTAAIERLQNGT